MNTSLSADSLRTKLLWTAESADVLGLRPAARKAVPRAHGHSAPPYAGTEEAAEARAAPRRRRHAVIGADGLCEACAEREWHAAQEVA